MLHRMTSVIPVGDDVLLLPTVRSVLLSKTMTMEEAMRVYTEDTHKRLSFVFNFALNLN